MSAPAKKQRILPLQLQAARSVLEQLMGEHPDEFVDLITSDSKMRKILVDRVVKAERASPQLADSDTVEIFQIYETHARKRDVKVKSLPFRFRAALKKIYYESLTLAEGLRYEKKPLDVYRALFCKDGVLEFTVHPTRVECETVEKFCEVYLKLVEELSFYEAVPAREDVPGADLDEIDVIDRFDAVMPDTPLHDAYDMRVNDREAQVLEKCAEDIADFLEDDRVLWTLAERKDWGIVWQRKQRVRFHVHMM